MLKRGAQGHLKSSNLRQQAKARRPLGFNAASKLAKARPVGLWGSLGAYELFPKPLAGDTSAFSECPEFRPDKVRIDGGLSYPSSVSAIAAGNYVLPSN